MTHRLILSVAIVCGLLFIGATSGAEESETKSTIIKAGDKAAIDANVDKPATVEGVVSRAAWSKTGKVMSISFKDAEETHFQAVVFEKSKERFDKAFAGDAAKTLVGAKVRVKGKLSKYAGRGDAEKATPQIVLSTPDQITVLELAAAGAASQAAE